MARNPKFDEALRNLPVRGHNKSMNEDTFDILPLDGIVDDNLAYVISHLYSVNDVRDTVQGGLCVEGWMHRGGDTDSPFAVMILINN